MATHTWVDLRIPEAKRLADLAGIHQDLYRAREFAQMLLAEYSSSKPNWSLAEPLSIAVVVTYSRCFLSWTRHCLNESDLGTLTDDQRATHEYLRAYRSRHVAHSDSGLEENIARANYCLERVQNEGITSISYGSGRVVSLSGNDLTNVIELTGVLKGHVDSQIREEESRLLPLVRGMPLEEVLAGGQKSFEVDPRTELLGPRVS